MESSVNCLSDSTVTAKNSSVEPSLVGKPDRRLVSGVSFTCQLCGFDGSNSKSHLYQHYEAVHPGVVFPSFRSGTPCPVPGCSIIKFHSTQLVRHLNSQHGAKITEQRLYFRTQKDFEHWRESEEKRVGVKFTKRCGGSEKNCILLVCQRYGTAQYSERREYLANLRQQMCSTPSKYFPRSPPQGNAYCPARINVRRKLCSSGPFESSEVLVVNYVAQHSHTTLDNSQRVLNVIELPLEYLDAVAPPHPNLFESKEGEMRTCGDVPKATYFADDLNNSFLRQPDDPTPLARNEVSDEDLLLLVPVTRLCESFQEQLDLLGEELRDGVPRSQVRKVLQLWRLQAALLEELRREDVRCEVRVKPMVATGSATNVHIDGVVKMDEVESAVAELQSEHS